MANKITVNTSTLRSKSSELKTQNLKFKAQIANLQMHELALNVMWDGEANTAFHNAFNKDMQQLNKFYEAINKYVNALEEIAKQYDSTEKANQSIAQKRTYK